jgi:hypothetical protein
MLRSFSASFSGMKSNSADVVDVMMLVFILKNKVEHPETGCRGLSFAVSNYM